jgi:hypothetical protein
VSRYQAGNTHVALDLPFTEPTGYGLARSGWVTASFAPGERVPLGILEQWVEESYRAVAPKRLSAQLDAAAGAARRSSRSRGKT